MDVDPMDYVGDDDEEGSVSKEAHEKEKAKSRLNSVVAITVALLAAFMALCNVKDGNIVQAMQQDQAKSIDTWAWYQAKKTRLQFAQATVDQLEALSASAAPGARPTLEKKIAGYRAQVAKEQKELPDTQKEAKGYDEEYDRWNIHDDQFDLSEAMLSLSIALMAATALTQKKWLYAVAVVPIFFGVLYGLAGLLGWGLHSNFFAKVLGT